MFFGTTRIARKVIAQAIEDITDSDPDIRETAINWIKSLDFDSACNEAELDPTQMRLFAGRIMKLPVGIRRNKVQELLYKYLG